MAQFRLEQLDGQPLEARSVEIVERKGLGHPDTICDMLSERLSVTLSQHYLKRFGSILHHNVDKALLVAGRAAPAFAAGELNAPIEIYLAGRATIEHAGERVPVDELAERAVTSWFRDHFHALVPDRHVRLHCLVRPGSSELVKLFPNARKESALRSNDTSCGVGFAPLTELERIVLAVEQHLNSPAVKAAFPACGQDIKIMGVREHDTMTLTVACAMIGRFLSGHAAYAEAKGHVAELARGAARAITSRPINVLVNTADRAKEGAIYLTVTGTSAEAGDDGETGRGNRANGLITPLRPMTLEAAAGKNPLTHVGKLYTATAQRIAEDVATLPVVRDVECYLVSKIGEPIERPQTGVVRVRTEDGRIDPNLKRAVDEIVTRRLTEVGRLWESFLSGSLPVC